MSGKCAGVSQEHAGVYQGHARVCLEHSGVCRGHAAMHLEGAKARRPERPGRRGEGPKGPNGIRRPQISRKIENLAGQVEISSQSSWIGRNVVLEQEERSECRP